MVELPSGDDPEPSVTVDGRTVLLSNLTKVVFSDAGRRFTKQDTLGYYAAVADRLLPHLADRCVTGVRFPYGGAGRPLYLKAAPPSRPGWVRVADGPGGPSGVQPYVVVDDVVTLLWLVNFGAVELHVPPVRVSSPDVPSDVVFDLDPGPGVPAAVCCAVAAQLWTLVEDAGLPVRAKTSGSKGLHLLAGNVGRWPSERAAGWARETAGTLAGSLPDGLVTSDRRVGRDGRVLIDWLQNRATATTAAVFTLRGGTWPRVSVPLSFSDLTAGAAGGALPATVDEALAAPLPTGW